MAEAGEKKKKTRKERERELRELDGVKGCGIKYDVVYDRHKDDQRYERELEFKEKLQKEGTTAPAATAANPLADGKKPSATFDALIRMETGRPERTIAEKINDSNRPTWEDYKLSKADKLDLAGMDQRKMLEYRKKLDEEREARLNKNKKRKKRDDSSDEESQRSKKRKKKKDKKRKKKKDKKKRKRGSDDDQSGSESESSSQSTSSASRSGDDSDGSGSKKKKKKKKKSKEEDKSKPVRLSDFMNASDSESD